MGHKKKNSASRSKQLPAAPAGADAPSYAVEGEPCENPVTATAISIGSPNNLRAHSGAKIESFVAESEASSYSAIKLECERALTSLRRGNYTKALRLMKESCSRHENSALINRVQGTVCVKVASIIDDPNTKHKHLRNAIDSARKAVELSPNSIEFAHFYANLLYEAANDGKEYEEVVQVCQRALAIENPVDPAKESLQDESQQKISTPEARVTHVQDELRSLIQKCNIASLSSWMKNLGNGDEKFRLIPIRRIAEDPMESRVLQARRPNEIKKATMTPEERRKEIEVRVAAARLLQQKSESPQLQNEGKGNEKGLDSPSGSGHRERRKNARKNASTAERRDWVRSYWNSMSFDMKKDLVRIKVSDLKAHFSSSKDCLEKEVITEALSFYDANKTWKIWVCCRCSEKFVDSESHMQHIVQEHMGNMLPKMQLVLPQSIDNEWIEMLLNCSWRPLDLSAAVKMLCNEPKCRDSGLYVFYPSDNMEDSEDCFKDAWDSSTEKESFRDGYNCRTRESNGCDKNSSIELNKSEGDQESIPFLPPDRWPISDDPDRAKLLEKIHAEFKLLIRDKCLAASHLNKVIQFTMDEVQNLVCGSQLLNRLGQSPVCICFLGALQLRKILKFLQDLAQSCGLSPYSDKSIPIDDANGRSQDSAVMEEIFLDGEGSCLILDEQLLSSACTRETSVGPTSDNVDTANSRHVASRNKAPSSADGFLSWIFTGTSTGEQVALWMRTKEGRTHQGLEIMHILEKEFCQLQGLCERKFEHLSYEEALQAVEDLCLEEGKQRETALELTLQSYKSVLRKRREELIESDNDLMFISTRFELDAITNVLKEAESLNGNQFGYEEPYDVTSQLRDLESGEADEWRIKDSLHQVDTYIEVAIQKQKEQLSVELSKIDARIMRNVTRMQQLELKLGPLSAYDYQSILLPLVKSYMRAHLEDLAEKDVTEKRDAARDAFLAELALDSKKDVRCRNDNSRHMQEKSKDKKKNKDNRKSKDSKVTGASKHRFNHETVEHCSFPVASVDDHSESEVVVSVNVDDSKVQVEEYRRIIELEEEERKLEETLEYQRRIENEVKQKHLAEQQTKPNCSIPLKVAEGGPDIYLDPVTDDFDVHKPAQPVSQEHWVQRNRVLNNLEGTTVNTSNGGLLPIKSTAVSGSGKVQQTETQQVMANGGASEAGVFASGQRPGRRGRRQKASNKTLDGKYIVMPTEKETKDSERQCNNLHSNGGDVGTKTLRQLQVEEDEEERFQADLKRAVCQSLDTYKAHQKIPSSMTQTTTVLEVNSDVLQPSTTTNEIEDANGTDVFGTGLQNEVGEYNCFLNVIIQSLWHLKRFRVEFLRRSTLEHLHVGDPCVVCALYEIFTALSVASTETQTEPVAPTSLRIALSTLYPDSNFFQEAQMNDASEVLAVIFDCLHQSFAPSSNVSDSESVESNCMGSWDCVNNSCILHSLFGMDIFEQMNCYSCGLESRHLKYSSFFHNINASTLRTTKVMCPEGSFDELLNLVEMNDRLACDPEVGGCGKSNYIHHILSTPPHVFTTIIGWQNTCETADDIAATLAALSTEIDISVMYRGLDPKNTYSLVSVVCYYGQHYDCFAYSHDHERWIMYDDKTVKVIGSWADVLSMCERGHLQPQVLLYEKL